MKSTILSKHTLVMLLSALLLILVNILFTKGILASDNTLSYKTFVVLANIGFCIFFVMLIAMFRHFFIPLFILTTFFGSILSYFKVFLGININESLIESVLNTNFEEAATLVSYKLLLWITIFSFIPSLLLIKYASLLKIKMIDKMKFIILVLLVALMTFYSPLIFMRNMNPIIFLKSTVVQLYPANLLASITDYCRHYRIKNHTAKVDAFLNYNFKFDGKGTKVVLVLGESARSDRFGINGYKRDTTPNLAKIKNMASFKDTYSLATFTIGGLENIFKLHPEARENTFISAFNKLGFKTAWITMQSFRSAIDVIASEATQLVTKDMVLQNHNGMIMDENLVPIVRDTLNQHKDDNLFMVVHTNGSHYTYDDRYPIEFQKYNPTCSSMNDKFLKKRLFMGDGCYDIEENNNSYDNTILYTDHVLSEIIDELKSYKSMVIYISDHGESLGENGIYLHSHEYKTAPKEQLHIPYILWFSEKLMEHAPDLKQNLEIAQSNILKKVDQSTVVHSLLDCIKIESNLIDKKKSICSSSLDERIK
jgi:lipid A ethanolaminephosphotransferase